METSASNTMVNNAPTPTAAGMPRRRPARVGAVLRMAWFWQLAILVVFLAAWQWVPTIPGAADVSPVFDRFFISSPTRVAKTLYDLCTGAHDTQTMWSAFFKSIIPAIVGTAIAVVVGALAGLICSNWESLNRVVRPFLVMLNALPRITLIPIVIVIAGPTATANIIIGFLVVFFLVFFNAYEGGVSVPDEALENLRILGAGPTELLRKVRWPYVMAWTFAQLPNAIAFGITAIVTAELFGGAQGLGRLLLVSVQTANADLTVAVAVVLGGVSLVLIGLGGYVRNRVLHWQ